LLPRRPHRDAESRAQPPDLPLIRYFRYFFLEEHVASTFAVTRDWIRAQILGTATHLYQLVCDGNTLRSSIVSTAACGSAFILQVSLCSAVLGLGIANAATPSTRLASPRGSRSSLASWNLGLTGSCGRAAYALVVFRQLADQRIDRFLSIKLNERTLQRQVSCQFDWEAQDAICCNASRDLPCLRDHLGDAGQGRAAAHQSRLALEALERLAADQRQP